MARKTDEERIAYAATVRGYHGVHVRRHVGNPDFIGVGFYDNALNYYGHMHTIENVLRWIRRQGRANA